MLLSTAYFPPVEYFVKIAEGFTLSPGSVKPSDIFIDSCEHYQKQSYRNRCKFYAENGVQTLQVPVVHDGNPFTKPVSEIMIDWSTPWMIRTQRAIASAYDSSPFFEYYKDELFAILDNGHERLIDLNTDLLRFFLRKTKIEASIHFTDSYAPQGSGMYGEDLREVIHPKRANDILSSAGLQKPYFQVFAQKYGFIPNLSIMDLLFNEGPESIVYLKNL